MRRQQDEGAWGVTGIAGAGPVVIEEAQASNQETHMKNGYDMKSVSGMISSSNDPTTAGRSPLTPSPRNNQ